MKILITENQFKIITETYEDGVVKIIKLYMEDGEVMVEYRAKDGEIYHDLYIEIMEEFGNLIGVSPMIITPFYL